MLYVPEGCAHGFLTLEDDTEVAYQMSHEYVPAAASGVRWNDPAFAIEWPIAEHRLVSERDRVWPDYQADYQRPRQVQAAPTAAPLAR